MKWMKPSHCDTGSCVEITWTRSNRCDSSACVEVAWSRSSNCGGGECVEVSHTEDVVLMRDSKDPDGPILQFTKEQWRGFIEFLKN